MRLVSPRNLAQTDMMMLHKIRVRRISARVDLINQLRGVLSEYGIYLD